MTQGIQSLLLSGGEAMMPVHAHPCPACHTRTSPGARFCSACGASLTEPTVAYRFVAVLYSDLSNYTVLSEQLEPEDLKELMDRIFAQATHIITRYDGIVEKFIGDAIVALFGVTQIHEDDVVRAIQAARVIHAFVSGLALPPGQQEPFSMHTGIHSGSILVSLPGGLLTSGALGTPINVAARLSALAGPGEILVGESAVIEAERYFQLESRGRKTLKGIREPLGVYSVIAERDIPQGVHRSAGIVSGFVGRRKELAALHTAVTQLGRGITAILWVTGEAGIGKSRIIQEMRGHIPPHIPWYEVHCREHAKHIPYFPIRALVRQWGASEICDYLDEPGTGNDGGADAIAPAQYRTRLYESITRIIASLQPPVIFCVEDVQWADPSSIDLLRYLFTPEPAVHPSLMILSSREERPPHFPGRQILLKELSFPEIQEMVTGMMGTTLPCETAALLYRDTGGNPFYIEEIINYLREGTIPPGETHRLPPTVKGVLAARFDRLEPLARRLLQKASVIGHNFTLAQLRALDRQGNEARMEILRHTGFIIPVGEGTYAFRHAIIGEAAYESLLKRERIALHGRIGRLLEKQAAAPALLAYHFRRAQAYPPAFRYSMLAAQHSQASGSWVEAITHYQDAISALENIPAFKRREETLCIIWEGIWVCSRIFDPSQAITALGNLDDTYRARGKMREALFARIRKINLFSQRAQFDQAWETFNEVAAQTTDDALLQAAAQTAIAYTFTYRGEPETALHYLETARRAFRPADTFLLAVNSLMSLAALVWKGCVAEARAWYRTTRAYCHGHLDMELLADLWLGYLHFLSGEFAHGQALFDAVAKAERMLGEMAGALTYFRTQSSLYFNTRYLGRITEARRDLDLFRHCSARMQVQGAEALLELYEGWIALEEGRLQASRTHLEQALPVLEAGIANRVPYAINALAETLLGLEELEAAQAMAARGIAWNRDHGNQDQLIWGLRLLGDISVQMDDLPKARQALGEAERLARRLRMKPHTAWICDAWARYRRRAGPSHMVQPWRRRASELWQRMENPYQADKVRVDH